MDKKLFELEVIPFLEKNKPFRVTVTLDEEVFIMVGFRAGAKTTKGVSIHSAGKILVDALTERVKSMGVQVIKIDQKGNPVNIVEESIKEVALTFKNHYDYFSRQELPFEPYGGLKATFFIRGGKMCRDTKTF